MAPLAKGGVVAASAPATPSEAQGLNEYARAASRQSVEQGDGRPPDEPCRLRGKPGVDREFARTRHEWRRFVVSQLRGHRGRYAGAGLGAAGPGDGGAQGGDQEGGRSRDEADARPADVPAGKRGDGGTALLVAAADGARAAAVPGEDDAVLAWAFRDELREGAQSVLPLAAERHAAPERDGKLQPPAHRRGRGPGDAGVPRRCAEPQVAPERKFRARGDGALHAR